MRLEVPWEIVSGAEAVVVRMIEEIRATAEPAPLSPASPRSPLTAGAGAAPLSPRRLSVRTVLTCCVAGGDRCGVLAQIATAIAAQGLCIVDATIEVHSRLLRTLIQRQLYCKNNTTGGRLRCMPRADAWMVGARASAGVQTAAVRNPSVGKCLVAVNRFTVVDGATGAPTFNPRRRREVELTVAAQVGAWDSAQREEEAFNAAHADAARRRGLGLSPAPDAAYAAAAYFDFGVRGGGGGGGRSGQGDSADDGPFPVSPRSGGLHYSQYLAARAPPLALSPALQRILTARQG
jgi:hypothetical protein